VDFFFHREKNKIKIIEFYFSKKTIFLNHAKSLDSAIFYEEISCLLHEVRNRRKMSLLNKVFGTFWGSETFKTKNIFYFLQNLWHRNQWYFDEMS